MNIKEFDFDSVILPEKTGVLLEIYDDSKTAKLPIIKEFTEQVLFKLLSEFKSSSIFEAGCAAGYSACFMKTCSPRAKVVTCDIDGGRIEKARSNFSKAGFSSDIKAVYGDAEEVMRSFDADAFDFVFIDAAKGQYPVYFNLCKKTLKTGGIAVFDNTGFWGMVTGGEKLIKRKRTIIKRMKEFLPSVLDNEDYESSYLPSGDGVLICIKKGG